jgi:hypothetical protein
MLSGLSTTWWVAGGWALDLFLGKQCRPHGDLDIGILRRNLPEVLAAMPDWEFFEASGGILSGPIRIDARSGVNSLWGRRAGSSDWVIEFLLDESAGDQWVYRRDHRIRRTLRESIRHDAAGIPYLAPEIQLLYKSREPRSVDDEDFTRVLPRLDGASRRWLGDTLGLLDRQHRWLAALGMTEPDAPRS